MADSRTIVVAGAGIGGLTAALTLAARSFRVIVLERTEKLEEAGAGLQLSPNASRILIDLGLEPLLAPHVIAPESISIMTARTAKEIGRIPLGEAATLRYGAPYWIVRRADLQSALLARVASHPDIDLRLGAQFEDAAVYPKGVTVVQRRVTTRQQEQALALIGADGVWSSVRHQIFPEAQPQFTGSIAWRGTIDASQLPRGFMTQRVQLWMGANAHLVAYPMSGGQRINMVAIVSGEWNRPGWSEPGDVVEIANHFADPHWPVAARMMIGAVDSWRKWALFAMRDGGVWNKGPIALLGDASHAMLPFAAQGAGMAIEDAAVIAKCLEASSGNPTAAFTQYAHQRARRVARVQRTARKNGQTYHLSGPIGFARDQVIRMLGGSRLLSKQDWIYDWRMS
ncbi:FAD-binding protein [Afipia massiliensis]|uniref:FAD-binding protein n=1 Tax=Afipia massiliensis TaxID=211460 RepID=A0A4U6BQA5_9BRAD|nr:FAD-dependent monooxygenase [Afipia massiliensis]TKT72612.1 FAD-binding protein [Afipia massiliensis]